MNEENGGYENVENCEVKSMGYPKHTINTFIENWPDVLKACSLPHETISVSPEDVVVLRANTPEFCEHLGINGELEFSDDFMDELEEKVQKFPQGSFPRIGYCSWKSSCLFNRPAYSSRDVLSIIMQPNLRIASALVEPTIHNTGIEFHLRSWVDIPRWSEFRIFMKNRKIRGISQYRTRETFTEITKNLEKIRLALYRFCVDLHTKSHMDTVIADVYLSETSANLKGVLIELNPFITS